MQQTRDKVRRAVVQATEKTFADMAFIDATEVHDGSTESSAGQLAHIGFTRPIQGQIILYMPTPLKNLAVENIYGRSWEEIGTGEFDDCLLELLNVLAGNFLNELGVSEESHGISLPQMLFDDSEIENHGQFKRYYFDAEGNPFQVSVCYCCESGAKKEGL